MTRPPRTEHDAFRPRVRGGCSQATQRLQPSAESLVLETDRRLAGTVHELGHREDPVQDSQINMPHFNRSHRDTFYTVYTLRGEGRPSETESGGPYEPLAHGWYQLLLAVVSEEGDTQIHRAYGDRLADHEEGERSGNDAEERQNGTRYSGPVRADHAGWYFFLQRG